MTLNPRGKTRLILKYMSKQKHRKYLFNFGFKNKRLNKVSSK